MIQIIPRVQGLISYGNQETHWAVNSGSSPLSDTFGPAAARIPLPWAATARNLVIYSADPTRTKAITVTLMKNGTATGLEGVLPVGTEKVVVSGIDVNFAQLDDFSYRARTPGSVVYPGYTASWALEVESQGNVFGMPGWSGSTPVNEGRVGGALGNGAPSSWPAASYSTTRSICASPGNITTLVAKTFGPAPAPGASWVAVLRKGNGPDGALVIQDGSGGTVDTRCIITAGNTRAVGTFTLPVDKGDVIEVVAYRAGLSAAFSFVNVAVGIGFEPTNADYFMLTGGSNTSLALPGFVWVKGSGATEALIQAPTGPSGLIARGLYGVRVSAAGGGDTLTHTIRRTGVNTPVAVTLSGAFERAGLIEDQFEVFGPDDMIDVGLTGTGSPVNSSFYWGLEATVDGVGPPPPENGTLIVRKVLDGSDDTETLFGIAVGGGLSPDSLNLAGGDSHAYGDVTPGDGYSVAEPTPPEGWELVGIAVSNDSPASNITVDEGESVTVTVTNRPVAVAEECVTAPPAVACWGEQGQLSVGCVGAQSTPQAGCWNAHDPNAGTVRLNG